MSYSKEEIKKCEDYIKQKSGRSIVEAFGDYIILASDKFDLRAKQTAITNGHTLGYYRMKDILNIVNPKQKPIQC